MYHFALNRPFAVGPVHHPSSLEVNQVFLRSHVFFCVRGEEASAQSLHPVVVPHISSWIDETGGGLNVLQLPKDF